METVNVTLEGVQGEPLGHVDTRVMDVTVTAAYTSAVVLADGTIIPPVIAEKILGSNGKTSFTVYGSDSSEVNELYRGFGVKFTAKVRYARGQAGPTYRRTVKVPSGGPHDLGSLPAAEPFTPDEWKSIEDVAAPIRDAAEAAALDASNAADSAQQAVTASQDSADAAAQSAQDAQTAMQAQFATQDEGVADLISTAAGPLTQAALDSSIAAREQWVTMTDHGATGDGVANDSNAFTAAASAAETSRRALSITESHLLGTNVALSTDSLVIDGGGTGELLVGGDGGIRFEPPRSPAGVASAASVGDMSLSVAGASWAVDEHVGKWVVVTDATINPISGDGTIHSRRIVSNTSNSLVLDEPIGYAIPQGATVEFVTPMRSITIRDITIRRVTPGGADLRISYVDEVILSGVKSVNAGTYGEQRGNGISIYHASRVRVTDCSVTRSGNFGLFVYHCTDAKVDGVTTIDTAGQFAVQLKDCRSSSLTRSTSTGAGQSSFNIKCSGLNESSDVSISDCTSVAPAINGVEFSAITAEGELQGERFIATGVSVSDPVSSGFVTIVDAGTTPETTASWVMDQCDARRARNAGYYITAHRVRIVDCTAEMCQFEGALITGDDVAITGGEFRDNGQAYTSGANRSSETYASGARLSITGTSYVRTSKGKTLRAHRDVVGASNTLLRDTRVNDTAGGYNQDYLLSSTSKAVGLSTLDILAQSTTVNKIPPSAA